MDWQEVKFFDAEVYRNFMDDPASHGYPGGENFRQVQWRASGAIEDILARHEGGSVLVVSHHVVNRIYLSELLGLPLEQARQVSLDNCGISVVTRDGDKTNVSMLNAAFHLQGVAA
jgi:broad specificity phosphatase PhoE